MDETNLLFHDSVGLLNIQYFKRKLGNNYVLYVLFIGLLIFITHYSVTVTWHMDSSPQSLIILCRCRYTKMITATV